VRVEVDGRPNGLAHAGRNGLADPRAADFRSAQSSLGHQLRLSVSRFVFLVLIIPEDVPTVQKEDQLRVEDLGNGFFRLLWRTGFMETPNVPRILVRARERGLVCEPSTTSYFLGRETLLTNGKSPMMLWRKLLFAFVSRNALSATSYFGHAA